MRIILATLAVALFTSILPVFGQSPNFGDPNTKSQQNPKPRPPKRRDEPIKEPPSISILPVDNFALWTPYESAEGGFSVKFPGKPSISQTPVGSTEPVVIRHIAILTAGAGRVFEADYVDFHVQSPALAAGADVIIKTEINYWEQKGGEFTNRRDYEIGTCKVIEATLGRTPKAGPDVPGLLKTRILHSGSKQYILVAAGNATPAALAAADFFLDSFSVTGGCTEPPPAPAAPPTIESGTDEGTLDAATGWRQFDTPHGISFMLPTAASTKTITSETLGGPVKKYDHVSIAGGQAFGVEVVQNHLTATQDFSILAISQLDLLEQQYRASIGKSNMELDQCKPFKLGTFAGRECQITRTDVNLAGTLRIFVKPGWSYLLSAFRISADSDATALDRFFSSYTIDPK